ncbi:MAG: hypothetical protein OWR52_05020 [Acidibacillus sp.]|nr:hypothetical protein [Acidibacillus sp.]
MWSLPVQTLVPVDEVAAKTQDVYGTLYEANTVVGKALAILLTHDEVANLLIWQRHVFAIGHEFSSGAPFGSGGELEWLSAHVERLQATVPLAQFILPNGTQAACELRHAAAVLQRASREIYRLSRMRPVCSVSVSYVDLSSAYLFYLSLVINEEAGFNEIPAHSAPIPE